MSAFNNEDKKVLKSGLRKHFRHIDHKIWLWSCERNVSKRDIKEFAKKAFAEAGYANFKASDGWYRRWLGRWKKQAGSQCIMTDNITRRLNTNNHDGLLSTNNFTLNSSCKNEQKVEKCAILATAVNDNLTTQFDVTFNNFQCNTNKCLPSLITAEETGIKDCEATNGLIKINNFKNTPSRKKGERYLPHFKKEVVTFAFKYSIKEAALYYKVHKGTVSDWIRESNKTTIPKLRQLKTELTPDIEFIDWLRNERKEERVLNKDHLRKKMQELLEQYQNMDVKKNSKWFYNYCKRFENNTFSKLPPIMYPMAFKIELALLCKKFSKKLLSDMFNIDRKRIRDWFHLLNSDNLKDVKRDVNNYLTDPNIDKQIWEWYQIQTVKPTGKQIRDKGTELYKAAGFSGIRCSPGWLCRWCKRYSLPQAGHLRNEKDTQLLEWLLGELDRNNNVSYESLKAKASQLWDSDIKPSTSWAIRFSKRYSSLLQTVPDINTELPETLRNRISKFRDEFAILAHNKNLQPFSLIAIDEIPLNFTSSTGSLTSKSLIRKSGFENCHASVIIACSSDGTLLPTTLLLKSPLENVPLQDQYVFVLAQVNAVNDETTICSWFSEMFRNINYPAIIICDDFEPHKFLKIFRKQDLQEKQIEIMLIPQGCNSKLQPICFSLSQQFKTEIDIQWSRWYHDNCWSSVNGLSRSPSELDIYNWVSRAHINLFSTYKDEIQDSFIKAGYILPIDPLNSQVQ